MASATLFASRRAICVWSGNRFTAASATRMPAIATTTSTSMRVNACWESVPVTDVGIVAFAAARPVGAQTEDVDVPVHAGAEVLVVAAPRILGQSLEVTALLPVVGHGLGRGPLHQRRQPLVGGGIETVVEAVELERLREGADVGLGGDA